MPTLHANPLEALLAPGAPASPSDTSRTSRTTAALGLAPLLGSAAWARLSPAIRDRFGASHDSVLYVGNMDLRSSRLGRLFAWFLAPLGNPLPRAAGRTIPCQVRVCRRAEGAVVWERRFLPHAEGQGDLCETVTSVKELDSDGGLRERIGALLMPLDLHEERGALVFQSRGYALALGRWQLPIPVWLTPGACRVSHEDLGEGWFRFTMSMTHPLWGVTVHQSGVFRNREEEEE